MEILHKLWNILVTEDEILTERVCISLTFIEIFVTMKLFTTVLNINYTKKQRNTYFVVMSFITIFSTLCLPESLNLIIAFISIPLCVKFIFKVSVIKSILAEIIPILFVVVLESIYLKLALTFFNITTEQCSNTILYRIICMLSIYATIFIISKLIKIVKINTSIFDSLDSYRKKLLITNLIFLMISIAIQFYLVLFYNAVLPLYITLVSLASLITYSIISIYSIIKTITLETTKKDLEQSQLHNKSLQLLYDNLSAFRHDFSNIVTGLGGFIYTKDFDGLQNYYNKILDECHVNNNLSTLNPTLINNPAIYNILATKYYKADELNIKINLQFFIKLNELKLDIYEFSRILAILLDNAIEASAKCENKLIIIDIRDVKPHRCQVLTIENTYLDENIDMNKLSEKGYTSKESDKQSHGIGLWQVSKIVKKHNNLILNTSKNDEFFKQELRIYY